MATATTPKFPDIEVKLIGEDSNGFVIACRARSALERAGFKKDAAEFWDDALSSNYDHLLSTCAKYVEIV